MSRRKAVVLMSAALLLSVGVVISLSLVLVTRTMWGRDKIRSYVENLLNERMQGKVHLGRISGSLFTDVVVDSFALSDLDDSLFIATGRITVRFEPRDFVDRRILIRDIAIEHPWIHVRQDSTGAYNYRKIFPSGPPGPPRTTRNFGDFIVLRNARITDGSFFVTNRWRPADSLSGARRDSAIAFGLGRRDKDIRRSGSFFTQTKRWTEAQFSLPYVRIADPDSAGRLFDIARLDVNEFDPPLPIRNGRGTVRIVKDSLWADFPHFELPATVARGGGKVVWGSDLPTRYDLTIQSDSMALADVAWVYPTLPTTGGGSMTLRIRNERELRVLDYELLDMDVRTMNSRLRGNMTFGVGDPVLIVKDVAMTTEPIDWALIERFTGAPLPYPWRGVIHMRVAARGGPVNRFVVDSGVFDFRDANVAGKGGRGRVRGELDMLFPAFTKFRGFAVQLDHFDLESVQFLNPAFARLDGSIAGRMLLDSVWVDMRFRDADLTHRFGDQPTSRVTGNGRITIGEKLLTYDVALNAEPIHLTTIAKAWPELEVLQRGPLSGPIRAQGTAEDLVLVADLRGPAGGYAYDGRVDIDSVGGYGYHGTLRFTDANLRALYDTTSMPVTALNGDAELALRGDSLPNYEGTVTLRLTRSTVDSVRLYDGALARLRFTDGVLKVDSAAVESSAGTLTAAGGLGLRPDRRDSLTVVFAADSLGALRPYLASAASTDSVGRAAEDADSLLGVVSGRVLLSGSLDSLDASGEVRGAGLMALAMSAHGAHVSFALRDVTRAAMNGRASITGDSLVVAGIRIGDASLDAEVHRSDSLQINAAATLTNGPRLTSVATVGLHGDTITALVSKLDVSLEERAWQLLRPTLVTTTATSWTVDSLAMRSDFGRIQLNGSVASDRDVALRLEVDSVALADLATLAQSDLTLRGQLQLRADVSGSREAPIIDVRGTVTGTEVGNVSLQQTTIEARVAQQRLLATIGVVRNDTTVLQVNANIPVDAALSSRGSRIRTDTLRVSVLSRDVDLGIVETFTPKITQARGRLNANVSWAGQRGSERLEGFVRVQDGAAAFPGMGLNVRGFHVDVAAERDTARIRRFVLSSGETPRDSMWLTGWVARERDDDWGFLLDLAANNVRAIDNRRTGRMDVSGAVRLQGRLSSSELSGAITVNSGRLVIPELSQKKIVALDASLIDTTLVANRSLVPKAPLALAKNLSVRNLSVTMGPDVWLQSIEANIRLGGSVNVINGRGLGAVGVPQLALEGALRTEQGTFNLRLGEGLLQRLFRLEGGQVRFLGDADFNPDLDISAVYTVRQTTSLYGNRNDIRIRARMLGTLVQPRLVLVSADSLVLSESDMLSYLVTGRPSAEIGGLQQYAPDLFLSNITSSLSSRFSGRFFDVIEFQTASGRGNLSQSQQSGFFSNLFQGAQLGVGKQWGERTFINLSTGLCPLARLFGEQAPQDYTQLIGLAVEQKLVAGYGLSLNREPPLDAILCSQKAFVGFAPSRAQYGFDLFKAWRW